MWGSLISAGAKEGASKMIDSDTSKTALALRRKEGNTQEYLKAYGEAFQDDEGNEMNPADRLDPKKRFKSYRGQFTNTDYLSNTAIGNKKHEIARIFRKNSQ